MSLGEAAMAALLGGALALAIAAWLNDPTSDAGCDDPRMNCSNTITIQESP